MVKPYKLNGLKAVAVSDTSTVDVLNGSFVSHNSATNAVTFGAKASANAVVMNYVNGDEEYVDGMVLKAGTDLRVVTLSQYVGEKLVVTNANLADEVDVNDKLQNDTTGKLEAVTTATAGYEFDVVDVCDGYVVVKVVEVPATSSSVGA